MTLTFLEKRTLESKEENLNTDTLNHYFYLMAKQYPIKFGLFRTNLFSFLRNEIPMNTSPVPESGNFVQILSVALYYHYVTIDTSLEIKTDQNDNTNYIELKIYDLLNSN